MSFNTTKLIVSIVLPQLAGIIGAIFTTSVIPTWYATLIRPSFSPPNWIFGPVWTLLYLLMGIALYRIWQRGLEQKSVRFAFWIFIAHLGFNTLWSILFFGLHNILYAFIDVVVLWVLIVALIVLFWRIDRWAAYLLIPYLIWVSFAAVLNYSFLTLNSATPAMAPADVVTEEDDREFLSLPGSGIWFSYPKGWHESYYDPSDEPLHVPKDSPSMITLTDREMPAGVDGIVAGTEVISMSIFTKEVFEQYKKDNQLSYYFVPGFEQIYANSKGQEQWESTNGFHVTEVLQPSYKTLIDPGPSPTPLVLAGIFSVELKNGTLMVIVSSYQTQSSEEDPKNIEMHRQSLYEKTKDLVQSISPL